MPEEKPDMPERSSRLMSDDDRPIPNPSLSIPSDELDILDDMALWLGMGLCVGDVDIGTAQVCVYAAWRLKFEGGGVGRDKCELYKGWWGGRR